MISVHSQQHTEESCHAETKSQTIGDCYMTPSDDTSNALPNTNQDNNVIVLDSDDEQDEDFNVIHHDTLLHDPQVMHLDPEMCPSSLTYAPGEG